MNGMLQKWLDLESTPFKRRLSFRTPQTSKERTMKKQSLRSMKFTPLMFLSALEKEKPRMLGKELPFTKGTLPNSMV